jgi:hypothetical protein
MDEIIFIVEEAPEGGTSHEPWANRLSPQRTIRSRSKSKFAMRCDATSMKTQFQRSFVCTTFTRKSSRYEQVAARPFLQRACSGAQVAWIRDHPPNSSHIRLTTRQRGEHHLPVPDHHELSVGEVSAVVAEVGKHFRMSPKSVRKMLFG